MTANYRIFLLHISVSSGYSGILGSEESLVVTRHTKQIFECKLWMLTYWNRNAKTFSKFIYIRLNNETDIFSFCGKFTLYGRGSSMSNNVNFVTYHLNCNKYALFPDSLKSVLARFRSPEQNCCENIKCNAIRHASMLIDFDNTIF